MAQGTTQGARTRCVDGFTRWVVFDNISGNPMGAERQKGISTKMTGLAKCKLADAGDHNLKPLRLAIPLQGTRDARGQFDLRLIAKHLLRFTAIKHPMRL